MSLNTHFALIVFAGDFDGDHPDPDLNGTGPSATLVAAGDEAFCWRSVAAWTERVPLRRDESVEVVRRDLQVVVDQKQAADHYAATMREAEG